MSPRDGFVAGHGYLCQSTPKEVIGKGDRRLRRPGFSPPEAARRNFCPPRADNLMRRSDRRRGAPWRLKKTRRKSSKRTRTTSPTRPSSRRRNSATPTKPSSPSRPSTATPTRSWTCSKTRRRRPWPASSRSSARSWTTRCSTTASFLDGLGDSFMENAMSIFGSAHSPIAQAVYPMLDEACTESARECQAQTFVQRSVERAARRRLVHADNLQSVLSNQWDELRDLAYEGLDRVHPDAARARPAGSQLRRQQAGAPHDPSRREVRRGAAAEEGRRGPAGGCDQPGRRREEDAGARGGEPGPRAGRRRRLTM